MRTSPLKLGQSTGGAGLNSSHATCWKGGPLRRRGFWKTSACGQTPDVYEYLDSEPPHGAHGDPWDGSVVVGWNDGALLGAPHARHALSSPERDGRQCERAREGRQNCRGRTEQGGHLTLPQSRCEDDVADAIFDFFLLSFSFSPANTTSLASFRHLGQNL